MNRALSLIAALLVLIGGAAAPAQTFPKLTGLVVDAANVLPPETEVALTAKLEALQKDTKRQLVVATIPDLQGYPLEDYGYRLGRDWGVGLKDVNNGAILFIAPNESKGKRGPRIEVGYGLEPYLTDAFSSQVIREIMIPRLKAGDVPGAMTGGTDALIEQLRANPDEAKARTDAAIKEFDRKRKKRSSGNAAFGVGAGVVFWVLVVVFIALAAGRRRSGRIYRARDRDTDWGSVALWTALEIAQAAAESNRRSGSSGWGSGGGGGWGSGGGGSDGSWGGGGFTGSGGGSFGGGGASGDW